MSQDAPRTASREPADREARRRVIESVGLGCVVEAGAGTGKTTLLVDRALALLASRTVTLDHLAMVTFTEKAAGELKVRMRQGIEAGIRAGGAGRDVFVEALESIDRATVTTIHAFAASLLRERPVEAGLDPRFRVFDELESQILRDDVFDRFWSAALGGRDADLEAALRLGVAPRRIRSLAWLAAGNRDLAPPPPPPASGSSADFVRRFLILVKRLAGLADRCRNAEDRSLLQIQALGRLAREVEGLPPDAARLRLLAYGKIRRTDGNKENWTPAGSLAEAKQAFQALEEERIGAVGLLGGEVAFRLGRWLHRFTRTYEEEIETRGGLDFQGLLLKARNLLRDDPAVLSYFQDRYRAILVDEFQDTDPLQAEILFLLSEREPGSTRDWTRVRPAAGRLFIVGDPKQSIYRFRRADIAVYSKATALLATSPGGISESITVNFRTVPGIVHWVNAVFDRLFGRRDAEARQAPYTAIQPHRTPLADDPPVTLLTLSPEAQERAADAEGAREVEAALVAALIDRVVQQKDWMVSDRAGDSRPASFRDFALLFHGLTGLGSFEEALRARDLPYRVIGGRAFYKKPETRHLQAVLRAIENPHDGLSVAAALRSPFFGCSDEDLFLYAHDGRTGGRFDYLRDTDSVPAGSPVGDAFELLRDLHLKRHQRPPAATIEECLDRTGALALVMLRPQGEQRVANLLKTVDLARRQERIGHGGFGSFVRFLVAMEEEERQESESPTVEDKDDVVRLMTVHQAKGLEFPIVVLADAAGRSGGGDGFCVDRSAGVFHFSLAFSDFGIGAGSWGYEEAVRTEKARAQEELCRLLYVAATRARDRLIVPVVPHGGREGSFLGLLRQAGTLPPAEPDGDPRPARGPLAFCRILEPGSLPCASPEPAPFRIHLSLEKDLAPDERLLSERVVWQDGLRQALAAAGRGRPIVTASSLEGPVAKAPAAEPARAIDARERRLSIGVAVHAVLESLPPGDPPPGPGTVRSAIVAISPGLSAADEADVARLVRAASAGSLPSRVSRAVRFATEFPFAVSLHDGCGTDVLFEGRIDLLLEEPDGCVLVDYKTDRVPRGQSPRRFARERADVYRTQAAAYAVALEALGARPKSAVLVFLDAGEEPAFTVDSAFLALGREAVIRSLRERS